MPFFSNIFLEVYYFFRGLPKNLTDWTILDSWVFDIFILADELFAKTLRSLKACVLVNNNSCGKLVSSLEWPVTFDERFKLSWVQFFILHLTY